MNVEKIYKLCQVKVNDYIVSPRIILFETKEDVEAELHDFTKDRKVITKNQYEDFLLSTVVVNIGSIVYWIYNKNIKPSMYLEFRDELLKAVYELNPELNPNNIIISNDQLKVASDDVEGTPLTELSSWESDVIDFIVLNPSYINNVAGGNAYDTGTTGSTSAFNSATLEVIEKVNQIDCKYKKVWWDRITSYLTIKQFEKNQKKDILKAGRFSDKKTYEMFLVTSMILNVEDVFNFVEQQGLLSKLTPEQIIHELYELVVKVNPFLKYDKSANKKAHVKKCAKKQAEPEKTLDDISLDRIVGLEKALKSKVVGQDAAIETITKAVKRAKVGLKPEEKPIGTFLFTGSTGVGKTLTAKVLHEYLMGKDGDFIRIDCSEYSADHEYSKLIGSPAGYVGYEDGGILTNRLMENPFAVVLFDEIEKASNKVHQLLLQVMDDGVITDNKGNKVSFKDTIIIMTSNIGVDDVKAISKRIGFGDVNVVDHDKKRSALTKAVKNTFKPEFINRIDEVVHFNDIDREACQQIIDLELKYVKELLERKHIIVSFSDQVKQLILDKGYSVEYGAREIKRTIEKHISNNMADYLIEVGLLSNIAVDVEADGDNVTFSHTEFKDLVNEMLNMA